MHVQSGVHRGDNFSFSDFGKLRFFTFCGMNSYLVSCFINTEFHCRSSELVYKGKQREKYNRCRVSNIN